MRWARTTGPVVALAVVGALGLGACGSDKKSADSTTTLTPEDVRADAAAVAAGLEAIKTTATAIGTAVAVDITQAKTLDTGIEPAWAKIEGTVKANDQDTYLTFEDNFAAISKAIEDGDAAKAKQAATKISAAADTYLSQYPG
jgi:hypothetical protein